MVLHIALATVVALDITAAGICVALGLPLVLRLFTLVILLLLPLMLLLLPLLKVLFP